MLDLVERRSVEIAERGLAASYVSPEQAGLPTDARTPEGMWTNYSLHLGSFAYNSQRVPEPARRLERPAGSALARPHRHPEPDPGRRRGDLGDHQDVQEAWGEARWTDYMTKLAAQNTRMGNYFQIQDMLAGGEIDIQVAAYPNFVEPFVRRTGARVGWAVPNPVMRTSTR